MTPPPPTSPQFTSPHLAASHLTSPRPYRVCFPRGRGGSPFAAVQPCAPPTGPHAGQKALYAAPPAYTTLAGWALVARTNAQRLPVLSLILAAFCGSTQRACMGLRSVPLEHHRKPCSRPALDGLTPYGYRQVMWEWGGGVWGKTWLVGLRG